MSFSRNVLVRIFGTIGAVFLALFLLSLAHAFWDEAARTAMLVRILDAVEPLFVSIEERTGFRPRVRGVELLSLGFAVIAYAIGGFFDRTLRRRDRRAKKKRMEERRRPRPPGASSPSLPRVAVADGASSPGFVPETPKRAAAPAEPPPPSEPPPPAEPPPPTEPKPAGKPPSEPSLTDDGIASGVLPERIGRYEVIAELGRGAMGLVVRARDPEIGREVAIKMILTGLIPTEEAVAYRERFFREARAAGGLSHPNIVTVYDIAQDEKGRPYMVMELVEGVTLEALSHRATKLLDADETRVRHALDVGVHVADALDYAHRAGIVHRDVKPANILVTNEGRVKLADFGVAKLEDTQLTATNQLLGTPAYMSPEQLRGDTVDARSDLFSFGAVLYRVVTGNKPFAAETVTTVLFQVLQTEPPPPHEANRCVPEALETVIARCLAKDADGRYASAGEVRDALRAVKEGLEAAAS